MLPVVPGVDDLGVIQSLISFVNSSLEARFGIRFGNDILEYFLPWDQ